MIYSIKLNEQGKAQLLEELGLPECKINLKKGIIQVFGKNDIQAVANRYGIDNVDNVPYQNFLNGDTADKEIKKGQETDDKPKEGAEQQKTVVSAVKSNTTKSRRIISNKIEVGSIVMVKDKGKTMHLVVVEIHGNKYTGARMILNSANFDPNSQILLVKDKDVIYKNPTYKDKVVVIRKRVVDLKEKDFIQVCGSRVVGKIIDPDTMQRILKLMKLIPQNVEGKATDGRDCSQSVTEGFLCSKPDQGPQSGDSTSETRSAESNANTEAGEIHFETAILGVKSCAELIFKLKIKEGSMLENAIICATRERQFSLKKLLPLMQPNYPKHSQNALKVSMNQELQEWIEKQRVQMHEASLVYFLKEVGRVIK